jgi:hypothetical protein
MLSAPEVSNIHPDALDQQRMMSLTPEILMGLSIGGDGLLFH